MAENPVITCPECDKKFKTKTDVRGKKIRCPFCNESFAVAADESTAVQEKAATPQPTAEPVLLSADSEEAPENDNPYGVTTLDLAPRCPNCANEMESKEAVVCLICGYNTLTREWGKIEKTIGVSFGRLFKHLLPGFLVLFLLLYCLIGRLVYSIYLPYWVDGINWLDWNDHESMRMWGAMFDLMCIFFLGKYCFNRFFVKPMPDEIKVDD